MRRCLLYSAAFGLAMLAIAGCGGDGDEETTAAPAAPVTEAPAALSKEELIAQGDGICAEVNAAVGTVGTTDSAVASEAVQVADLYEGMVERLRDLGRPSDDSAGYDEFIAAAEELGQAESDVQLAAERGEEEALATAESDASSALASFQSAASAYGLTECAEGPSAPAPGAVTGGAAPEEPVEGIEEEEIAPEVEEEEVAPETGGAGSAEEAGGAGGGAPAGGGTEGGGETGGGESSGGGIGPG
ncbi:MAG TPA: hypothetical protein VF729_03980 [Solirubrobacterales bacterium]